MEITCPWLIFRRKFTMNALSMVACRRNSTFSVLSCVLVSVDRELFRVII